MQEGKIYRQIIEKIAQGGGLTFMQFDPPNYPPQAIGGIAKIAEENGIDAFAVGGSLNAQGKLLNDALKQIKENSSLPRIMFPGNMRTKTL